MKRQTEKNTASDQEILQIPIAHLQTGQEEADAVVAVLASDMIAQGPITSSFENEFAT